MGRFAKRETTLRATMAANKLMIEKNFKCHENKIEEAKNAEAKAEDLREAKHSDAHFQNISDSIKRVVKERRIKANAYNNTKQSFKRQHKHHSFLRDTIDAIHHLINKHVTKQRQEETAKALAMMSSGSSGSSGASGASRATGVAESGEVTDDEDDIGGRKGGKKNKGGQDQQSLEAPAAAEEPAVLLELEAFAQREGLFLGGEGDREHSQEAAERTLKAAEEAVEEGNTEDPA